MTKPFTGTKKATPTKFPSQTAAKTKSSTTAKSTSGEPSHDLAAEDKAQQEYSTRQFFLDDYPKTLFPLATNKVLIEHGETKIRDFIESLIRSNHSFLPQKRVYAAKDALHLRRTVKLDPVAEFFIYDIIYRNRGLFRKPHVENRKHFGYRFEGGRPIPASTSYQEFKDALSDIDLLFTPVIGFDVASYFNHVYHHDLVQWFAARGANEADVILFGKFLREGNAGRTLDCLPQGLYPTKMIGNDFLRFIDESHTVRATSLFRFMDDFYLFSDDEDRLQSDFLEIQRLLGQKGLTINAAKTTTKQTRIEKTEIEVSKLKRKLLERRRSIIVSGQYTSDDEESSDTESSANLNESDLLELSPDELAFINSMLRDGDLAEDDAELILTVMRRHASDVTSHLPKMTRSFPHLAKNIAIFCAEVEDKEFVAKMLNDILTTDQRAQEYQLFWFAFMLESYLLSTKGARDLIYNLFNHTNATDVSKAKILEIADQRFGLPELRMRFLTTGQSDWLSWSSAAGSRGVNRAARNYILTYFKNSSAINRLIGDIIETI